MAITKSDLIDLIYGQAGLPRKECLPIIEGVFEIIKEELEKGNDVMISGFGKWTVKSKKERKGRNPQTGEGMAIAARRVVTFKPSPVLKNHLNV